jgi:signal transduction histidine kinase
MEKRFLIRSAYARTILSLTLAILICFSALGLAYYVIATQGSKQQQTSLLLSSAQALAEQMAGKINNTGEISDQSVASYISFIARSTDSLVWVVNRNGEIILNTGLPAEATGQLAKSGKGYYELPIKYRAALGIGTSGLALSGDFRGLLTTPGYTWISAIYPIRTSTGTYNGEIQIHFPQKPDNLTSFLLRNSLIASFLIAILIALFFVWVLSRNITKPIRMLSRAADQVSRGDLSVRVLLPGMNAATKPAAAADSTADAASEAADSPATPAPSSGKRHAFASDDLTVLVSTINTMIEKLENQERNRKDFISSVSHDLRTPITSIKGFVEGMLDGTIPQDRYLHYLEIVKQETLRLQNLVNTMFDATMFEEAGQLNQTVFDINAVLKEDVIGLEPLLAEKRLGVQTDFLQDEQGRLLAIGDRAGISRVVYNLLSNAIRFTPEEGVIALATRRTGKAKQLLVIIEDSGPGIPESEYPYIFDRFYKVDKSRTAKGSGLGLFICRSILAAHGQKITVDRSDLGGARFTFTLATP